MTVLVLVASLAVQGSTVRVPEIHTTRVRGQVFELGVDHGVSGVRVSLRAVSSNPAVRSRTVRTDSTGHYEFTGVAAGRYRLGFARIGYRPAEVELEVHPDAPLQIAVGLAVQPVRLEPVEVTEPAGREVVGARPGARRSPSRRDLIARDEIEARAPTARTAFDLVRRLRPTWLTRRGSASTRARDFPVVVYIENVRRGDVESLRSIPADGVRELWFVEAIQATQRWGTGHTAGVIHVLLRP